MKALIIALCIIGVIAHSVTSSRIRRTTNVCASESDGTTFPVEGTCSSYYYCANQMPVELPCPNNMQFSLSQSKCVSSALSGCYDGTTTNTQLQTTLALAQLERGLTGNECIGQQHGALIPYPGDCTKYLVCEYNSGTVMNCPGGLYFNPVLCVCDWPTSAGCTEGSSPTPSPTPVTTPTTTPAPTPTSTTTTATTPITTPTPIPILTTTTATTPTTTPTPTPTPTTITTPTAIPTPKPTPNPTSTSTSSPSYIPTLPPDDDVCATQENGALSPYPWDCGWYIRCENNAPVISQCESGWLFNPILLICDYPDNAGCIASPYPTTTITTSPIPTSTPTSSSTTTTPSPTPTTTPSSVPTLAPDDNVCENQENGALSPYPWDCAWYIRCENNAPVISQCESGWLFNPILLICDYPDNAGCIATPYPTTTITTSPIPTSTPTSSSTTTTPSPTPTTTPSSVPTLALDDNVCENQENGALSPYPWDCAWYIRCENNAPVISQCESGWLFNPILLICDYPDNAGCIATPYPTTNITTSPIPTSTPTSSSTTTTPSPTPTTTPSSVPTLAPDDNVCENQENGALSPYPWDCAWYIRCENNAPVISQCESGWLFNPILLICDYPDNAGCIATPYPTTTITTSPIPTSTPTSSSTTTTPSPTPTTTPSSVPTLAPDDNVCENQENGALLPYPWDCGWYIRCENNAPVISQCESGWLFNPILLICDYPNNAGCIATPYPTSTTKTTPILTSTAAPSPTQIPTTTQTTISTPTPSPGSTPTTNSGPTSPTTDPIISTIITSTPNPSTQPPYVGTGICANQELGTVLPYPGKCSFYIVCEEMAPIAISCGPDLEFNAELKSCQTPEEAGCSIIKTTSTTTELTTTPATGVGICASHPIGDLIPYPGNCSQYIRCELPVPIALECSDGLEFNAELQLCESAEEAGCSIFPGTTTTVPGTPTTPATPPGMTGICRGQQEGDLIPYPGDCGKYIICENPIPIAQKCSPGLHFNADLGICDEPEDAECTSENGSSTIPPQTTTQSPSDPGMTGICRGYQENDLIPYPGSCIKYIRCETPVPIAQTCKSGLYFNEVLGICDSIESASCPGYSTSVKPGEATTNSPTTTQSPPTMSGICLGQESGDLIPYPGNCSKYIVCESPVPIAIACRTGLHFNAELQICDDPAAANCETLPSTTTPTTTLTPPSSNICCGLPIETLVPYPEDCTQYIRCDYPIPAAFSCSSGLHFNAATQKCETIENANCQWYTTTTTTTTTTTAAPLTCATQPNGTLLPFDGDCKKYNYCSDGSAIPLPCPVNMVFSVEAGSCVLGSTCPQ